MQPTKLYESLFIFHKSQQVLEEQSIELQKIIESDDSTDKQPILVTNYIIMETCSFIHEFHKNFARLCESDYKDKVTLVKAMTKPIFKRVNKWTDLNTFRNNIIAHPWRDGDKFVVPDMNVYNVPRNWFEHIVLVHLMRYIYDIIRDVFKSEFEPMLEYMASLKTPPKEKTDYKGITLDHVTMAQEVDEIARKKEHKYNMKVMGYKFE